MAPLVAAQLMVACALPAAAFTPLGADGTLPGVTCRNALAMFALVFLGFAVLAGLFPFHTWAPTGHVAAPTAASMHEHSLAV